MAREFEYDWKTQRYRVTEGAGKGQFLTKEAITNLEERAVAQSGKLIAGLNQDLAEGKINIREWQARFSSELRDLHLQAYALGNGGWENLTADDYTQIRRKFGREMEFFEMFSWEISEGKLSQAQIEARAQMYANRLHSVYESGRESSHKKAGYTKESRHRQVSESCSECIEYADAGIVEIGTLPAPGEDCRCRSNCKCYKQYYKPRDVQEMLNVMGTNGVFLRYG